MSAGLCAVPGAGTLRVNFADLARVRIDPTGLSPAALAAYLQENGANDIPRWESYILGLDTTDSTALPYADISVGDGDVTVSLEGVEVNQEAGWNVRCQVVEIPDLAAPNVSTNIGAAWAPGASVPPIPMGEAASRFFRVKVILEPN